jgi:hypothetical protein
MTDSQTCPLNLDYADDQLISLDLTAVRGEGVRIRRRRRVGGVAATAVLGLGLATGVYAARPSTQVSPSTGTDLTPIAALLHEYPARETPAVVSTWPDHWTTVAWATGDNQYCYAAYRLPAAGTNPQSQCESIDGDLNADENAGANVGMPLPVMAPMENTQTYNRPGNALELHPFVGVTRGGVARVAMTAPGGTVTADVTPMTTENGLQIGVYQIWFTWPGGGWNSTDIQSVVAYAADGTVVTRQGPWIPPTKPTG